MKILYSILAFVIFDVAAAQYIKMTPSLKTAFDLSTQLKLEEAESYINKAAISDEQNLAVYYSKGALLTVKLFIDEDEDAFDSRKGQMDYYIQQLERAPNSDPQKRFMISQLRLGLAILNAYYQNNITAGWQFYKAYNLLEENKKKFPDYYPNRVPLGVLYAAIGSLPDDYQSIASIIGIKGSVKEGMKMIHNGYWNSIADKDHKFYRDYFGFVYSYTSLILLGESDISPQSLSLDYGKSAYLSYMQAQVEMNKGNARKALEIMKSRPEGKEYYPFPYLDYYTGKIALAFSPETAIFYLNKYMDNRNSENYLKSAHRYLSWAYMLKGEEGKMEYHRSLVMQKGQTNTGADRQAAEEAATAFNQILTKARIWFDGGLYAKAGDYLENNKKQLDSFSKADQVEYHYRLGRIYQELKNYQKALSEFSMALDFKLEKSSFSEANSALQSAYVLEKMGALEKALRYYEKTLQYKGFPFYEGLHQKAKSGIDRLK